MRNPIRKLFFVHAATLDHEKRAWRKRFDAIVRIWSGDIEPNRNFGLLRLVTLMVETLLLASPAVLWQTVFHSRSKHKRKFFTEIFVILKPMALWSILRFDGAQSGLSAVVAVLFLADLYLYWISILLVGDLFEGLVATRRTVLLLTFNLAEQVFAFAILYLYFGALGGDCAPESWEDAVYFSAATATTVGYGDCVPTQNGRWLVVLHVFLSVGLLFLVVGYTVGHLVPDAKERGKQ